MAKEVTKSTRKTTTKSKATTTKPKAAAAKKATKTTKATAPVMETAAASSGGGFRSKLMMRRGSSNGTVVSASAAVSKLAMWNRLLALVYIAQGVAILLLAKVTHVPLLVNYQARDTLLSEGNPLVPAIRHLMDLNVAYTVAVILFIFALSHLLAGTVMQRRYNADLASSKNGMRWMVYAFGLGGLICLVALLCGVVDLASLLMIFVLVFVTNALFRRAETAADSKLFQMIGRITFVIAWVIILLYVLTAVTYDGNLPGYLYWLVLTGFLLTVQLYSPMRATQQATAKTNYASTERWYMVMAFIAVTAVVWQIFAGALR